MAAPDTNPDVSALAAATARRDQVVAHLHGLLLRAARFGVFRRRGSLPQLSAVELDELAQDAAEDAAVSVLRRLDDFRGESSFRTWAYKFAQLDRYVELELAGAPADELVPGLRADLVDCPACAEEHEGLRALLELDSVS